MGMIDVSEKEMVLRTAIAEGKLTLKKETIDAIRKGKIKKGNPFEMAEASALLGIKTTFMRIPHCHPIPITSAELKFSLEDDTVICKCEVKAKYKTGVEMEALNGVTSALLTIWDMVKYLEKDDDGQYPTTAIHGIRVIKKQKGDDIGC